MNNRIIREDYEGDMAKAQLKKIESYAAKLNEMIHPQDELEAWVQAKLSVVAAYMGDVKHYLDYELQKIGEGEVVVEEKEEKEYVGPYKEGGITESHSDQMIDIMNKDREREATTMYRVKPSTTAEDMLEAREMLGMAKWNKLSREEKKDMVAYLKLKGDIGHFGQEEDIETISGMQYYMAKGGEVDLRSSKTRITREELEKLGYKETNGSWITRSSSNSWKYVAYKKINSDNVYEFEILNNGKLKPFHQFVQRGK